MGVVTKVQGWAEAGAAQILEAQIWLGGEGGLGICLTLHSGWKPSGPCPCPWRSELQLVRTPLVARLRTPHPCWLNQNMGIY